MKLLDTEHRGIRPPCEGRGPDKKLNALDSRLRGNDKHFAAELRGIKPLRLRIKPVNMLDINKLKLLRSETGISVALCKKALEESLNDLKKAKELLNKWGIEKVKDKENRITADGAIFSYVHHNKKIASLVEINCETDFVAKTEELQKLGREISMQVASVPAKTVKELLNQEYIREPAKKISDLVKEAVLKLGENIKISRFLRWQLGEL